MTATDGTLSEREEARLWLIPVGRTGVTAAPNTFADRGRRRLGVETREELGSTSKGEPVHRRSHTRVIWVFVVVEKRIYHAA